MKFLIDRSFERDAKKLPREVRRDLSSWLAQISEAESLNQLPVTKLSGSTSAYRLRIGNYRIGFYLEGDTLILSRVLDRKEIYKYFPRR